MINHTIIEQSNDWVRLAIVRYRITRDIADKSAIYDALSRRRRARATPPKWWRDAWEHEQNQDLKAWGRTERTYTEMLAAVALHAPESGSVTN